MIAAHRNRRFAAFKFVLEVDGTERAGFGEASGLAADTTPHIFSGGTHPDRTVPKIPGLSKFANITLKRGVVDATWLREFQLGIATDNPCRYTTILVLYDGTDTPIARYRIERARITKFAGPSMIAKGNDVAIESLDLIHEGLTLGS